MSDFPEQVIAQSIDYLVAHYDERPDLETLAKHAGYETTHFQKLFRAKVGISPKKLVQYMHMRKAAQVLESGGTTMDAFVDSGLSGAGRLHDLFVSTRAITPGKVREKGKGIDISYGFFATPIGRVLVAKTQYGVCYLGFIVDESDEMPLARMKAHLPLASYVHNDDAIAPEAAQILNIWSGTNEKNQKLPLDLYGTNLQIQVWQALLKIPYGRTCTYKDIATQIEKPKASRAVGNAVGANPISLLIPCHRVIRGTGIIDNYGWGSPRKKLILGFEGVMV
jgi:AraC family transcriptional regulator of adaptative response/methylated-DNA-[protein]-cysteine methyltransferase